MTLNLVELQKLIRTKGAKVTLFFKGQRYGIVISDLIFPVEKTSGRRVDWFKAFGLKKPEEILSMFQIDYMIYERKGTEEIITNFKDLENKLKSIQ